MKRKRSHKRGYPVALLVDLTEDRAVLWQIFSHIVRQCVTLKLADNRTNRKALYIFHESLVGALKPFLDEGVRSVVVAAPIKTTYATDFLDHVRKHHSYLIQPERPDSATFVQLTSSADPPHGVAELVKTKEFRRLVMETTSQEADQVLNALERHLGAGDSVIIFSLEEIEDTIYARKKLGGLRKGYLMLTDKYLAESENKNRLHRLFQISKNSSVKTRILNAEMPAGRRVSQFGGIVFFTLPTN